MPNCGWNCQFAVGDNRPVPYPLAVILGHLVGSDAPGRRASGSHNSICFLSSDERRIALPIPGLPLGKDYRHDPAGASLDRINHEKGYVPGNVRVISLRANLLRRDIRYEELRALAEFFIS
jgi:hypothetical protein